MELRIAGLKSLPEVRPGDGLAELIREAARREGQTLDQDTILVVAQKIVSKAEGALVDLRTIQPSEMAIGWARELEQGCPCHRTGTARVQKDREDGSGSDRV